MKAILSSLFIFVASIPLAAHADVTPPDVQACFETGGSEGSKCTLNGTSGTCQKSTCARLDYSHWDGGMPGSIQYDCLKCIVAVSEDSSSSSGGCGSVARPSTPKELGALFIAGSFSLLFLLKRRRRGA